ncbi:ATPase [Halogranum amylolyticum]|uniref:ATPase n=1 Tax=Halogranum amylolyticum TaxID=660520 RepID=A0A1H8MRY7_9EURY|nr:ATPase [Halogranum amylolyticum]
MDRFVDRETELSRLRECYDLDEAEMVVIFGRRRLGKTGLVRQSLSDGDDAVLYQATETTPQVQLDEFVDVASESFPGVDRIKQEWESLLGVTSGSLSDSRPVVSVLVPVRLWERRPV